MNTPNLNTALDNFGKVYVSRLKQKLLDDDTDATGALANSLTYEVLNGNTIQISALEYGGAISEGSSPSKGSGKPPLSMVSSIKRWAEIKGMRPQFRTAKGRFKKLNKNSMRSLAYAISTKILRNGIIKRFNYSGTKLYDVIYDEMIVEFGDSILNDYGKDIEHELRIIIKPNG